MSHYIHWHNQVSLKIGGILPNTKQIYITPFVLIAKEKAPCGAFNWY